MTERAKIISIYAGVAVISVAFLALVSHWSRQVPDESLEDYMGSVEIDPDEISAPMSDEDFEEVGRQKPGIFFPIEADLEGVRQDGKAVKLSDLKGKVWLVAEFFAVCPHCAVRNGQEMKAIYEKFEDHPDFRIVCVSVDPKADTLEHLQEISKAMGADPERWWFFNAGDEKKTHQYMEKTLKFFGIRERTDPLDIESNGRFAHDLGLTLVDREWNVIGKWPLAEARSEEGRRRDPQMYEKMRDELYGRIAEELEKNETAGAEEVTDGE